MSRGKWLVQNYMFVPPKLSRIFSVDYCDVIQFCGDMLAMGPNLYVEDVQIAQ
jgi:hypothetical protein